MPRPRRPPGAGPALTILALLFLPSLLVAAQQQQPLQNGARSKAPRVEPRVDSAHVVAPQHHHKPSSESGVADADRRRSFAANLSQNERAVATKVSSAPAVTAVRAHPARNAASGALVSSARSLQDWEVEDFVLLATVDGHIHARDRYNGEEIWELAGKPMLETVYNISEGKSGLQDQPFIWIVEPREDGALYVLTPGPYPVLQSLGLTVKQLTDIAPYSSDDPDLPVVWNVEKKTFMIIVDASTGIVKQSFSPGGAFSNDDSCAPESRNFFKARERDCRGIIDLGQTEYKITIHNKQTNEHLCTIKYAEWNPNSRDKDLQAQYRETMDKQYIYSRYNGEAVAYDHKRLRWHQRPLFTQLLPFPVARVFDVARPTHDESAEPPLVLLPQPVGPAYLEDLANLVLLNTTDTGAWYALSEVNYPAVTDGATAAKCYNRDNVVWDAAYKIPEDKNLVGVHELNHRVEPPQSGLRAIAAPTNYAIENDQFISVNPVTSPREGERPTIEPPPLPYIAPRSFPRYWVASFLTFIIVASCIASYKQTNNGFFRSYVSKLLQPAVTKEPLTPVPTADDPEPELVKEEAKLTPGPDTSAPAAAETPGTPKALPEKTVDEIKVDTSISHEAKEKKVTFDIPDEDEDDLSPLSRTTTAEQPSPTDGEAEAATSSADGEPQSTVKSAEDGSQDPAAPPTPKKKKTHRGKRGGRKLNRNQSKDDDEVGRIVDAAKQLEVGPRLHPDEMTMNDDDIQDVSNIKRIGKLTIDQDKLLGNGSGGTFVFEGKWNVSINEQTGHIHSN